jgi:cytochrome c biogenesis protein
VSTTIEVNEPLSAEGARVYLVGHGYAPHFVIRDSTGSVVFDDSVVFLPQDGNFTSTGVVKVPDAKPSLALNGLFLPTTALDQVLGPHSTFPGPDDPSVFLSAFTGDLGLDSGVPQSVYQLDTAHLTQIGLQSLYPGQTWTLDGGQGSVEFTGFQRWASFQIAYDPGKGLALAGAALALTGLMMSLFVRRRRVWVKVQAGPTGGTLVHVAGLAKAEGAALPDEVAALTEHLVAASIGPPPQGPSPERTST